MLQSYKDLVVWQKSKQLSLAIYHLTRSFPAEERYVLSSQMRRAAISIPANIAEGYRRRSRKEYRQFLFIAFGSGAELETYLELVWDVGFGNRVALQQIEPQLAEVMRMLNRMTDVLDS